MTPIVLRMTDYLEVDRSIMTVSSTIHVDNYTRVPQLTCTNGYVDGYYS